MQQRRQEEPQEPRPPRTRPRLAPFQIDCYTPGCDKVAVRLYPARASVRAKLSPRHYHHRDCNLKDWRERRRLRRMALRRPHPCTSCGAVIEPEHRPGRPRTYCRQCSDRRRRARPRPATVRKAQQELDGALARADAVARTAMEARRSLEAAEAMAQRARAVLDATEKHLSRWAYTPSMRTPEMELNLRRASAAVKQADAAVLARRAEAAPLDELADVAMGLVRRAKANLDKAEERAAKKARRERQRRASAKAKRPAQPRPKPPTTHLPQAEQLDRERARSDPEYRTWALARGLL